MGAATWGGMEASRQLSQRPRQMRLFRDALQMLDAEIMFGHTPLRDAAILIAKQIPLPVSRFFDTFAEGLSRENASVKSAWEDGLDKVWPSLSLKKSEYEILVQFGETLGKHDRINQQKHIMLTLTHLGREEDAAREKQKQYEKMAKSLGFLGGLLFIILLL